jgi:single-stranded DNA-binding protein
VRVAVDDERGAKTSFIAVACYAKLAETARRYVDKDRMVAVTGWLVVDEWATDAGSVGSRFWSRTGPVSAPPCSSNSMRHAT